MEHTIHTIDPNFWYISGNIGPHQKAMAKELTDSEWKSTESHCPVYTVLIATSYAVPEGAHETCKSYRGSEERLNRCRRQYLKAKKSPEEKSALAEKLYGCLPDEDYAFCAMDRTQTAKLFGDAFIKIIDIVKKPVNTEDT